MFAHRESLLLHLEHTPSADVSLEALPEPTYTPGHEEVVRRRALLIISKLFCSLACPQCCTRGNEATSFVLFLGKRCAVTKALMLACFVVADHLIWLALRLCAERDLATSCRKNSHCHLVLA